MKRAFVLVLIVFSAFTARAQFPSEVWHEGEVVLAQGDSLTGLVKYDLETDLVQFTTDQRTIQTFTARKLLHFEIFDKLSNRYRQFYTLPFGLTGDYQAPIIFELVFEGKKLTLLGREAIEYQVTNYPSAVAGSYTRLELVFTHFFLTDEGRIIQFDGKKNSLLRGVMSRKSSEIKKFIKSNHLRSDRRGDLIKIVSYYNSLYED
ncbi:hypothetical protein E1176_06625 [Fulvivirga sp. RKSG066]|uniref:hypothetical protein n=1 Tax=Fulvivirga aurantia TaxID=2529383 RepID=UPI0012BBD7B5|nr:hypothetical protein [Fulvivirga aurantia]MTI20690.1 hypothetical protein [Fulvivirga aurantia]